MLRDIRDDNAEGKRSPIQTIDFSSSMFSKKNLIQRIASDFDEHFFDEDGKSDAGDQLILPSASNASSFGEPGLTVPEVSEVQSFSDQSSFGEVGVLPPSNSGASAVSDSLTVSSGTPVSIVRVDSNAYVNVGKNEIPRIDSNAYINIDSPGLHADGEDLEELRNMKQSESGSFCNLDDVFEFTRLDEIGRGGFGVIYKVKDELTGKIYAQKVLEVGKMKNSAKSAKRQFLVEAKVLFMCPHHPHIIKMIHAEEDKDAQEYMITLELAGAGSVKDFWNGRIPIPEPTVQNYVKQILLGLEHLHKHKIVYRDLKLSNMLLMSENHIKLADFGISKVFEDLEVEESEDFHSTLRRLSTFRMDLLSEALISSASPTSLVGISEDSELHEEEVEDDKPPKNNEYRAKELVGTLFYQPPEMLQRSGHSFKMDIWSLGIIIWQMLFGGMPFLLRDKKQIKRIMKKGIRFPRKSDVSEDCEDFIQKCLLFEEERMSVKECLSHPWIINVEVKI